MLTQLATIKARLAMTHLKQIFDWECCRVGFATVGGIVTGTQFDATIARITALGCLAYVLLKVWREWRRK